MDPSKLIATDWPTMLLTALAAGAAAYFGTYLAEKAKQKATKEAIDELLEQARKTTLATEEIKTTLAGGMWVGQERWKLKRDVYTGLLQFYGHVGRDLEEFLLRRGARAFEWGDALSGFTLAG